MDNNNVNPYIMPGENIESTRQLKENQKLNDKLNNAYFPNQNPYDLMKDNQGNQGTGRNVLEEVGEAMVKGNNPGMNYYGPAPAVNQPPMGYPPIYGQPMGNPSMMGPPRPMGYNQVPSQSPQMMFIQAGPARGPVCNSCRTNASVVTRSKAGCAVLGWCTCLLCFTGLCCWIPCVIDDCYDHEMICANCMVVRGYIKSPYGC